MIDPFGKIHSRCHNGWHKSIQAVSERLEMWGHAPEEAYRIASCWREEEEEMNEVSPSHH